MDRMKTFFKYFIWVVLFYFFSEFITTACLMSIKESDEPCATETQVKEGINYVRESFSNPSIEELINEVNHGKNNDEK